MKENSNKIKNVKIQISKIWWGTCPPPTHTYIHRGNISVVKWNASVCELYSAESGMWGADEGSSALSASVKTREESSHTTVHGQCFLKPSRTTWWIWPCGISGLPRNSQEKTEKLMKSGLSQLRKKQRHMACLLGCVSADPLHYQKPWLLVSDNNILNMGNNVKYCICRCFESDIINVNLLIVCFLATLLFSFKSVEYM